MKIGWMTTTVTSVTTTVSSTRRGDIAAAKSRKVGSAVVSRFMRAG